MSSAADVDIIRESLITFLSDSLDKVAGFVAFVYFANYFSTGEFGSAYTVIGVSMMAASVPKAVGTTVSKRISEDVTARDRFFVIGVLFTILYSSFAGIVLYLIVTQFQTRFEALAVAALVHLTTRPLFFIVERVFDGVGRTGFAASLDFFDGLLTAVLRFLLILGLGLGAEGLLYSSSLSAILIGSIAYTSQWGVPTANPTIDDLYSMLEFGTWSVLSRVSGAAFQNFPTVISGIFISPSFASWVRSAQTLTQPGMIPTRSVVNSIFVQVSGDSRRGKIDTVPIQNGIDTTSILTIPILSGSFVLGDLLMVTLYGVGYGGSGYVLVAIALMIVFDTQNRIMRSTLNGSDNPDAVARANTINAVLWGVLLVALATISTPVVFLIGTIVAYASWMATNYWYLTNRVISSDDLEWRFVAEQFVAAAVMAVGVWAVRGMIDYVARVELAIAILTGAALYGVILIGISQRGRRIVRSVFDWVSA